MTKFLVDGHIREYKDIRELEISSRDWVHRILNRIRECEKYDIDYDSYLPQDNFREIVDILDCCLDNKDSKFIDRKKHEL